MRFEDCGVAEGLSKARRFADCAPVLTGGSEKTTVGTIAVVVTKTFAINTYSRGSTLRSEVNRELNFPPNFEGLVLGCIDADFCK